MMEYKGYIGAVEFDDEAKILSGRVMGIRDVITFQAENAGDILKEFRASVDDYLDFCKQRGEEPDSKFSGKFVLRLDPELHRKLNMVADAEKKSLNAVAAELLGRAVGYSGKSSLAKQSPRKVQSIKAKARSRHKVSA